MAGRSTSGKWWVCVLEFNGTSSHSAPTKTNENHYYSSLQNTLRVHPFSR